MVSLTSLTGPLPQLDPAVGAPLAFPAGLERPVGFSRKGKSRSKRRGRVRGRWGHCMETPRLLAAERILCGRAAARDSNSLFSSPPSGKLPTHLLLIAAMCGLVRIPKSHRSNMRQEDTIFGGFLSMPNASLGALAACASIWASAQTSCCPGRNSFWICRLGGIDNCRGNDVMPCCLSTKRTTPSSPQVRSVCSPVTQGAATELGDWSQVQWCGIYISTGTSSMENGKSSGSPHFALLLFQVTR
ncbi:hypothetical protein QBC34DRAFT_98111 [Podospora aff. communis PSN243]|uniref:Uncharacterized protein n=1 Tax=Podospora aff. communis PSN243 TaxID=3040156 RepID=A0AAV9GK02_9PEZI|nr:hypothetical protein QBC34DRAFT_98111 [Podospora aff. communis PSN243]